MRILIIEDNDGDYLIIEELLADTIAATKTVRAVSYYEASNILT